MHLGKVKEHQLLEYAVIWRLACFCVLNVVDGALTARKVTKAGYIDGLCTWIFAKTWFGSPFALVVAGFVDMVSLWVLIAVIVWEVVVGGKAVWPSLVGKGVNKLEGKVEELEEEVEEEYED